MRVVNAPKPYKQRANEVSMFLAGSIEMGVAEPWQDRLIDHYKDTNILFLNPRRPDWDSSWKQEISDPKFNEQVSWELSNIESADLVVFYFDPNTKSPITLMELGYVVGIHSYVQSPGYAIIVCCPDGFWRKGNVDIICERNEIPVVNTWNDFILEIDGHV